ncbi:MAG: hypothetical protein QXK76_02405 [Candidatus Woesearchaeota archaeon]
MNEEEVIDFVLELDKILEEAELFLQQKDFKKANLRIKEARSIIEDLKEDDESEIDREEVEIDILKNLK